MPFVFVPTRAAVPEIDLGSGVVITAGHWLDFTDRIRIGATVLELRTGEITVPG